MDSLFFNKYDSKTPTFSLAGQKLIGRVVGVYDGDTMTVVLPIFNQVFKFSVRLDGIDTCEMKSKSDTNKNLAKSAKTCVMEHLIRAYSLQQPLQDDKHFFDNHIVLVRVECHEFDKYGRLLANVYPVCDTSSSSKTSFSDESLSTTLLNQHLAYSYAGKTKLTEDEQADLLRGVSSPHDEDRKR
jgi:endonuclease YncB( thermonuclease family)